MSRKNGSGGGRFVEATETQELHAEWWDEGEVVVVRRFGYLDRKAIQQASATMLPQEGGGYVVRVDAEALDREMMVRGIQSWTLKGANGKVTPLTRQAIERLGFEDGEFIVEAIASFNERRAPEAQESFRGGAGDGAAAGDGTG